MSKLISLGLLALLLSLLASPAVAESGEECEELQYGASPGLYGLCIAYHNADSARAQERILENYEKKAGPDDPPMPGIDSAPCPCFTSDELAAAGAPTDCAISSSGTGIDLAFYNNFLRQFGVDSLGCFNSNFTTNPPGFIDLPTTSEENEACRNIILEAIDNDAGFPICQEGDV